MVSITAVSYICLPHRNQKQTLFCAFSRVDQTLLCEKHIRNACKSLHLDCFDPSPIIYYLLLLSTKGIHKPLRHTRIYIQTHTNSTAKTKQSQLRHGQIHLLYPPPGNSRRNRHCSITDAFPKDSAGPRPYNVRGRGRRHRGPGAN